MIIASTSNINIAKVKQLAPKIISNVSLVCFSLQQRYASYFIGF
jgi:hypothetical protein